MPVEDRLRQGLEDIARSFSPEGEQRLEQVHHRRRRRTTAVATSVGTLAVLLGAGLVQVVPWAPGSTPPSADDCSSVRGRTAPEEDTMDKRTIISAVTVAALASACDTAGGTTDEPRNGPRPSSPSSAGAPRLPERGGWGRDATAEEGLAIGVPRRIVQRLVDKDDVVSLGMNLRQGVLTLWTNDDDWEPSAWDLGTYEFQPGRRLVLTSMSDRCPGCTTTMTWRSVNGDAVFDSVERGTSSALAKWLWEGRWDYNPPE